MAHSAAARVFGIPELLENILDYLPTNENEVSDPQLFVIQRVSHDFRGTICGSPRLHERMYQVQSNSADFYQFYFHGGEQISCTEILMRYKNAKVVRAWKAAWPQRSAGNASWQHIKISLGPIPIPLLFNMTNDVTKVNVGKRGKLRHAVSKSGGTFGDLLKAEWSSGVSTGELQKIARRAERIERKISGSAPVRMAKC